MKYKKRLHVDRIYRIFSNNIRGQFLFSHQKEAIIRGKAIIREGEYFKYFSQEVVSYTFVLLY